MGKILHYTAQEERIINDYLGGSIEFNISSVCCAILASIAGSFCLAGGPGTGPAPLACTAGDTFKARALKENMKYNCITIISN